MTVRASAAVFHCLCLWTTIARY